MDSGIIDMVFKGVLALAQLALFIYVRNTNRNDEVGPVWCAVRALLQKESIRKEIGWEQDTPLPYFIDYITMLGAETKLPTKLLEVVKVELCFNAALALDFPEACGSTKNWKIGEFTTKSGVKMEAFGAEQAIRGTFHGASRPKLLLGDDLITDKEAKSPTERDNRWDWLEKAVDFLGPPEGTVKFVGVGTILNKDDPISRAKKAIGHLVHHFRAIEKLPDHMDLWERCQEIMLNDDKPAEEEAAKSGEVLEEHELPSYLFYLEHKAEMDAGAEISWPTVRSLFWLMRQRAKNARAFGTEMQGEPRSDEDKVFSPITIVMPWSDTANMVAVETELQSRWGGMDMRTGHVFSFKNGTAAGLSTYGSTRNSPHSSVPGLNKSPTLPWVVAAQFAAAVEFSGSNDPAIPFRGIDLPDVMAPTESDRFTQTERNLLLHDGISTIIFDESGKAMVEQVVTTYQTNTFGLDDRSLLKLNTKWTVDYFRYVFRSAVARDYPAHKLTDDDNFNKVAPGQKITCPKQITNTLIAAAAQLQYVGLLEDLEGFKRDIKVVRSVADECRVNSILPPNVVNQFDVFAAAVQFIL